VQRKIPDNDLHSSRRNYEHKSTKFIVVKKIEEKKAVQNTGSI
jgi:hypothetical protein